MGDDLVRDLAFEDPHGQVTNVGKMIVERLTGHAGSARESGDCHLRQWRGHERVAQRERERRFRIGVGHRRFLVNGQREVTCELYMSECGTA